jgi:hypothetical protein
MIETRVVEFARVSAAVNRAHMTALKARLSRKKVRRVVYSVGFRREAGRWRKAWMEWEIVVVRAVVVLRGVSRCGGW